MIKYVIKRLFYAIPVFLGITFTVYLLINLAPGGPLSILAASGEMSLSDLEALKASLDLISRFLSGIFCGWQTCCMEILGHHTVPPKQSA